jgi:hypothetical protein
LWLLNGRFRAEQQRERLMVRVSRFLSLPKSQIGRTQLGSTEFVRRRSNLLGGAFDVISN